MSIVIIFDQPTSENIKEPGRVASEWSVAAAGIFSALLSVRGTLCMRPPSWVPRPLPSSDPTWHLNPVIIRDLQGIGKLAKT